jgi:hypothetical protein
MRQKLAGALGIQLTGRGLVLGLKSKACYHGFDYGVAHLELPEHFNCFGIGFPILCNDTLQKCIRHE